MINKLNFKYFKGPTEDISALCDEKMKCSLCGNTDIAFDLDYSICPELGDNRDGKYGCISCLKNGRFSFWHDTDIGVLDENGLSTYYKISKDPKGFPEEALNELRQTPQIVTWQQERWLTHCNDFMVYQGTWMPDDFYKNAPGGDGRALFLEMTDENEYKHLWDESLEEGEDKLTDWHATYYVFKCIHCGELKGYWDCD